MKSPRNLYKVKVITDHRTEYILITLAIYILNYKQRIFEYVYTSSNTQLPKETRKYMYRLCSAFFPIPIVRSERYSIKEFLYLSTYFALKGGGFA